MIKASTSVVFLIRGYGVGCAESAYWPSTVHFTIDCGFGVCSFACLVCVLLRIWHVFAVRSFTKLSEHSIDYLLLALTRFDSSASSTLMATRKGGP